MNQGDHRNDLVVCIACHIDHHRHCGMQLWCQCDDPEDGESTTEEVENCVECNDAQASAG